MSTRKSADQIATMFWPGHQIRLSVKQINWLRAVWTRDNADARISRVHPVMSGALVSATGEYRGTWTVAIMPNGSGIMTAIIDGELVY